MTRLAHCAGVLAAVCCCCAVSLLVALAGQAQAATITVAGGVANLSGEIIAGDASRVRAAMADGRKLLRVRSAGGDMAEALALGRVLLELGVDVEVSGICASACAMFVLPGARTVTVEDGAVIALHAAGHGAWLAAEQEGALDNQPPLVQRMAARMLSLTRDTQAFLAQAGIRPDGLEFMYRLTSIARVSATWERTAGNEPALRLTGNRDPLCRAWLLGPRALAALGVRVAAWQPPGLLVAASVLNEPMGQLYDGPAVPVHELENYASCIELQFMAEGREYR